MDRNPINKEEKMSEKETRFWLDAIVDDIIEKRGKNHIVNGGWSVSGPIHLGNLRADGIIIQTLADELQRRGCKAKIYITVYDHDPYKAKPTQLIWFENKELAELGVGASGYTPSKGLVAKYKGVRFIDVPDPFGCHDNWSVHWLTKVQETFSALGLKLEPIRTSKLYKMKETKKAVMTLIENKSKVIKLMNKYRKRNPYPEDWIPFNGWCPVCHNINDNKPLEVDYKKWEIKVRCSKCGEESWSSLEEGKLQWKLEWATVWHVLGVTVEPYGKDHAVKGGSKDQCQELQREILGTKPPYGFMAEWIGKIWKGKDLGDMSGSGNILWTSSQFLEIAEPEIFRYFYIGHDPTRRFAWDFENIDRYYDDYDKAERIFYGIEKAGSERDRKNISRAFELSQVKPTPKDFPFQLSYSYAAQLTQILPEKNKVDRVIAILKRTGQLDHEPTGFEKQRIKRRLELSRNWVGKYSEKYRLELVEKITPQIVKKLSESQRKSLKEIGEFLKADRNDSEIWDKIKSLAKKEKMQVNDVFEAAYTVLLDQPKGPRLILLIKSLDRDFVVDRFLLRK